MVLFMLMFLVVKSVLSLVKKLVLMVVSWEWVFCSFVVFLGGVGK